MIKGAPMSKVVHSEIPVDDQERAAGFYRDAPGWEISRSGDEPPPRAVTGVKGLAGK